MQKYLKLVMKFFKSPEGSSAVEYGLLVGLIAAVVAVGLSVLGTSINGILNYLADNIQAGS